MVVVTAYSGIDENHQIAFQRTTLTGNDMDVDASVCNDRMLWPADCTAGSDGVGNGGGSFAPDARRFRHSVSFSSNSESDYSLASGSSGSSQYGANDDLSCIDDLDDFDLENCCIDSVDIAAVSAADLLIASIDKDPLVHSIIDDIVLSPSTSPPRNTDDSELTSSAHWSGACPISGELDHHRVCTESSSSGTSINIRDRLKKVIHNRLEAQGQDVNNICLLPPPKQQRRLTEEDVGRQAKRRRQNCLAARRSRDRKQSAIDILSQEVKALEDEKRKLESVVEQLSCEMNHLRQVAKKHDLLAALEYAPCQHNLDATSAISCESTGAASTVPTADRGSLYGSELTLEVLSEVLDDLEKFTNDASNSPVMLQTVDEAVEHFHWQAADSIS